MSGEVTWVRVAPTGLSSEERDAIAAAIERELAGRTPAEDVLADSRRRRVFRVAAPGGGFVVKRYTEAAARRLRDRLRSPLLGSPAQREWRALDAARDALSAATGAPLLPQPLALLRARDGDWLVSAYVEARPLLDVLDRARPRERRRQLEALGAALRALGAARLAHGDLHVGNIGIRDGRPVFVDWPRSRANAPRGRIERDLADLEFSLARGGVRRTDRLRLRRSVLGPRASHSELRDAGKRTDAAAHDHYRGRTRRALVEGRRFAAVDRALGRGMRAVGLRDEWVGEVLAAHDRALRAGEGSSGSARRVLKDDERSRVTRIALDGRTCVVKEVTKRGLGRQLADPFRGSPARRGWLGGHGLLARGLPAAEPLAFVELAGRRSILLLDDASPRICLGDEADPAWKDVPEGRLADALVGALLALHRRGVDHGDLQASHLFAEIESADVRGFTLIDFEGVRFAHRLRDAARLRALAELNASLGDARLSNEARLGIFERYERALPFAMGRQAALRAAVARSLARRHRWTGAGCEIARPTLPR